MSGLRSGDAGIQGINRDPGNVISLARSLFSTYLLPFEATSVLLVVAIVGVMVLARRISATERLVVPESEPDEELTEGAA